MNTNAKIFLGIIVLLVAGVILTIVLGGGPVSKEQGPGQYDAFAACLEEKGAIFYGTFWCKFCNQQKKMFGSSQKLLPYTECSTPDAKNSTQICIEKDIKTYPTWDFADGSRLTGVQSLETLAEKTSCQIEPPKSDTVIPQQ